MKVTQTIIDLTSRSESVDIILMGDVHLGSAFCNEEKLMAMIEYIRTKPNCYWLDVGDKIEAINYSDPRFQMSGLAEWLWDTGKDTLKRNCIASNQMERYIDLFKPIKDKCLGLGTGNHEETAAVKYHHPIHETICGMLKVENLGWSSLTQVIFRRILKSGGRGQAQSLLIGAEHGASAAQTAGGRLNALYKYADKWWARPEIYITGHGHHKTADQRDFLKAAFNYNGKSPEITSRKQYVIQVPSFYSTYKLNNISYGEKKGYSPAGQGVVKIEVRPFYSTRVSGKKRLEYVDYHVAL